MIFIIKIILIKKIKWKKVKNVLFKTKVNENHE